MGKFKKRVREPSTWAGFAAIFQALAYVAPQHAAVLHGLTAVAGCVAAQLPEQGAGNGSDSR